MRGKLLLGCIALMLAVAGTTNASAAVGPVYDLHVAWGNSNLEPGGEGQFVVQARNVGDAAGSEEKLTLTDHLPEGVTATALNWQIEDDYTSHCSGLGTGTVVCEIEGPLVTQLAPAPGSNVVVPASVGPSGDLPTLYIDVSVDPGASGTRTNTATIEGGGAPGPVSLDSQVPFSKTPAAFGLAPGGFLADFYDAAYPFGSPDRVASDRPFELRVNFGVSEKTGVNDGTGGDTTRYITPTGQLHSVEVTLPRGFIGNPEATPKCEPTDFAERGAVNSMSRCPADTQIGYLNVQVGEGTLNRGNGTPRPTATGRLNRVPIYNLVPPRGVLADFGINTALVQAHIYPTLDPSQDYAVKTTSPNITTFLQVRGTEVTIWGVPGDPVHDRFRARIAKDSEGNALGNTWGSAAIRPFLTNPMDCDFDNGGARIRLDSYERPGDFTAAAEYGNPLNVTGCDDPRFRFEPDISLQPTSTAAGGPTGLDVHLEVPQRNDEVSDASKLYAKSKDVKAIATPPIKKAVVTLPEGMTISPSAAQGLASCSAAQIGIGTDSQVTCPDASQFGTLVLKSPALPQTKQIAGRIYVAEQGNNPFHGLLAIYLVIEDSDLNLLVKVPGRVDLDPRTGQITTSFDDLPQLPVSDMQMTFKGGVRSALVNPQTCGPKTITATFYSWQDPSNPHTVTDSYDIGQKPDGSPCVNNLGQRPFRPQFEAGTTSNKAGSYSPFVLRLNRADEDQEFSRLSLRMPPGLTGKLAGISRCPDFAIARAEGRTAAGQGVQERANPSCPGSSEIGVTEVGAGVGVPLTFVSGKVYLAGPYRGSPLSVVVISPVVVGPFDLGVIVLRTALNVDSTTAQVTATSDPFPQIFQGIPVRIRDVRFKLDREDFIVNPTGCNEKQIEAGIGGAGGDVYSSTDDTSVSLTNRFQAAECANLAFKPRLSFRLFGATHRGGHPRLRAVVRARPGDANFAAASVALPHSEFLDQAHIKTVCTRVQFAAKACPAGSIYGYVMAKTPLFDEPLTGPIYLRSSSHPLPDLVAALIGPASLPVEVDLAGRVDSVNGGIRNSFEVVPDAPVSWATFSFLGGKKGLLVNSTDLCAGTHRATAKIRAQNGKEIVLHPELRGSCGKKRP